MAVLAVFGGWVMLYVNASCNGCGDCVEACPVGAIRLDQDAAVIDQVLCNECGACIQACKEGAIQEVLAPQVAPQVAQRATPAIQSARSPVPWRAALGASVLSLAPVAIDLLSRLAHRWLSPREAGGPGFRLGGRGRRSWSARGGRCGAGVGPRRLRRSQRRR